MKTKKKKTRNCKGNNRNELTAVVMGGCLTTIISIILLMTISLIEFLCF